jgi:hypothetical protein
MIYTSEHEVIVLVQAFHNKTLSPTKWNHAAQLTVTLYYGLKFPYAVAFDLLREGFRWVTVGDLSPEAERQRDTSIHFWLQTVKAFAIKYRNIDDISALANIFVSMHKETEMPYNYYSREFVFDGLATVEMSLTTKTQAAAG